MALNTGLPLELNKPQGTDFFDEQRDIATNMQIINDWAALVEAHRLGTTGEEHALAIAGGRAGFFSGSDKAKLDTIEGGAISRDNGDLRWLGINAVAVDSAKLGNVLAANFARRDVANNFTALQTFYANAYLNAATGVDGIFRFRANSVDKWDIKFDQASGNIVIRDLVQARDVAIFKTSDGKLNAPAGIQINGTDLGDIFVEQATANTFSGANTFSSTVTLSGGVLNFTNATTNRINLGTQGVGAPTLTSYSVGTKLVLHDGVGASTAGYALGVESSNMWFTVNDTARGFKFYGGTTLAATLSGAGALTLVGGLTATTGSFSDTLAGVAANFSGVVTFGGSRIVIDATTASATRANIKIGDGSGWSTKFIRTNDNASIIELIDNIGLNIGNGMKIQHNGTDVLDASRNLKNIGSITSSGSVVTTGAYHNVRRAGSGDWAFYADVSTDTVSRWAVRADGFMEWGAGGSTARDTNLYRSSASVLKTDHNIYAVGYLHAANSVKSTASAVGSVALNIHVSGDTQARYVVFGDGKTEWGVGGTTARDTNLYRSDVDTLKTDDAFHATFVQANVGAFRGFALAATGTTTKAALGHNSGSSAFTRNAYYDGSAWQRDDTGSDSWGFHMIPNGGFEWRYKAAGTGTISWDVPLRLYKTGNLVVAGSTDDGVNKLQVAGNAKITGIAEATTNVTAPEVHVKSSATAKRFKLDYNETDDTLDFIFSES